MERSEGIHNIYNLNIVLSQAKYTRGTLLTSHDLSGPEDEGEVTEQTFVVDAARQDWQ